MREYEQVVRDLEKSKNELRELRNVIRRAVVLASDVIEPEHMSLFASDASPAITLRGQPAPVGPSLKEIAEAAAADAERQAIRQALQATGGNRSTAARHLRTDYKTLYLKMKHVALKRVERQSEQIDADMVEQRSEPFFLPCPRCLTYALQRL